jgi:hypothetical protein
MKDRIAILEARQLLLLRAARGEFSNAPVGEFERRWDALDPASPAPQSRSVMHQNCECDDCMKLWSTERERPMGEIF